MFTGELIGHMIEIISASNPENLKVKGEVVNETKYTLQIRQGVAIKTIMKRNTIFRLDGKTLINGSAIMKRPEERIRG